ncbi:hypothetical protein BGW80DRAFT_1267769 [Lactifluus volemus]|nr:hypothetical protein BGW80DRAFT_1267769 [Lactifluus volemus]
MRLRGVTRQGASSTGRGHGPSMRSPITLLAVSQMPSEKVTSSVSRSKGASAPQPSTKSQDDEIASNDINDGEDDDIDSVEYLLALQQIRQKAHQASRASSKRDFKALAAEFRGHATAIVDEMSAYMRVSWYHDTYIRVDTKHFRDELEVDTLKMQGTECISTEGFVTAAREWNIQRSMVKEGRAIDFSDIQREEEVNEVSKLIEGTDMKHARARRRLLRKVKVDLEEIWKQGKIVADAKEMIKRYKKVLRG